MRPQPPQQSATLAIMVPASAAKCCLAADEAACFPAPLDGDFRAVMPMVWLRLARPLYLVPRAPRPLHSFTNNPGKSLSNRRCAGATGGVRCRGGEVAPRQPGPSELAVRRRFCPSRECRGPVTAPLPSFGAFLTVRCDKGACLSAIAPARPVRRMRLAGGSWNRTCQARSISPSVQNRRTNRAPLSYACSFHRIRIRTSR